MPELPEVETVRRGFHELVAGRQFSQVEVYRDRLVRTQLGGPSEFRARLLGQNIEGVARRGKFMWLALANGQAMVVHLGMSGQIRPLTKEQAAGPARRHERVRFWFQDATEELAGFSFIDQRTFGSLQVCDTVPTSDGFPAGWPLASTHLPLPAAKIARDLLDPYLDTAAVINNWKQRVAPIKTLLLAQNVVSGFGNIYADEALFAAKVRGTTPAGALSHKKLQDILDQGARIMTDSLSRGGTSFDALYVDVNGESGTFADYLQVYGRAKQPCRVCGQELKVIQLAKRSHHYCVSCQRSRSLPRLEGK
ncbi:DNA-formamidopyrimidine glycosylase [Boudabousia tangfeifanii]|uniref:DNA-formamidopyrimidine glycosylase n=1 Tax=Boudabousia tangfeifanii TaxID=1912795 RepID=A0A1D9MKV6_9ACTO|nr:bifunctional DNA-formamidopyrimidine glycosylase/DNA-(apurinic or apyrimidinic site) lyase [Boudabousia tangfeifanii]AOZ72819.1 DNA-formamidopyrimidine glycosylase [Boudabousia tangfeifanii]